MEPVAADLYAVDIAVNDCFKDAGDGEVKLGYFSVFDMTGNKLFVGSEDRSTSPHTWVFPTDVRFRVVP